MRKTLLILFKLALLFGLVAVGGGLALELVPGLSLLGMGRLPTSPYCSRWQAVRDADIKVDQIEAAKHIAAASRLVGEDGRLALWETPAGNWWLPAGNPEILAILLAQQRRNVYGDAESGVHAGDVVLDGGAHIGTYVRKALDAGAELVVAIEPSPDAVKSLKRNFEAEIMAGRVIVYPKGVWDKEETLTLYDNGPGAAGDSFVGHAEGSRAYTNIPVTTLDRIVDELRLERVDFIKADVKGATERMLHGGASSIKRFHPRIAISTETPPEEPGTIAKLLAAIDSYQARGGPCFYSEGEIRTDVMFFH